MTTATGTLVKNFAALGNVDPYTDTDFTYQGTPRFAIVSGQLRNASGAGGDGQTRVLILGNAFSAGTKQINVEIGVNGGGGDTDNAMYLDASGNGYRQTVDGTNVRIELITTYTTVAGTLTSGTLTAPDVVTFEWNGAAGYSVKQGATVVISTTDSTYTPTKIAIGTTSNNSGNVGLKSVGFNGITGGGTPGNASGTGATQNATAPAGTAAVTGVFPGYADILRDTDTGAPLANATGLIMSARVNSDDATVIWKTASGTTDATGKFKAETGLAGSTGSIGSVGASVYLTVENSAKTICATYKVTLVDLGS